MNKTVIEAGKNPLFPNFAEIFDYRQLLISLAWRDIKVKYAQTYIGLLWAFINPIFNILILSFVFGVVVNVDTKGVPQILFTVAGLSAWTYFSTLINDAGNSIVNAQSMIKKIYFPRLVVPLSKAIAGLVDFGITLICLIIIMIFYGVLPGANVIYLPVFLLFAIISGLTGGILVSALTTRYRDFSFVVPMIVRVGLYATPIAYSASAVPEKYKLLYFMNPMAGIVEGFRWSLLGVGSPEPYMFYSIGLLLIIFVFGLYFFAKVEHKMADIL
jgi:lipopolysaccharide transport system permease protein